MRLIGGRNRNFAVTKDGGLIPVTIVDIPKATKNVEQFQFLQSEKGALTLRIVKREGFSQRDIDSIYRNLHDKFGEMLEIDLEFVETIPRTGRGKLPLLVQDLRIGEQ